MDQSALVSGVFVGHKGATLSESRDMLICEWDGVVDDRHYGRTKPAGPRENYVPRKTAVLNIRQVSVVSEEELADIALLIGVPDITGPDLGANIVLKNIEGLTQLRGGTVLKFPERETLLVVIGENEPCKLPGMNIHKRHPVTPRGELTTKFREAAKGRRGIVAMVMHPGPICPGDTVEIVL